jgi:hypothetical protein
MRTNLAFTLFLLYVEEWGGTLRWHYGECNPEQFELRVCWKQSLAGNFLNGHYWG